MPDELGTAVAAMRKATTQVGGKHLITSDELPDEDIAAEAALGL